MEGFKFFQLFQKSNLTQNMSKLTVQYLVEGLSLFAVTSVCIAGNIGAIWYFSRKNSPIFYRLGDQPGTQGVNNNNFSLMITLCVFDLVLLISSLLIFPLPILWPSIPSLTHFIKSIPILLFVKNVGVTGSPQVKSIDQNI